MNNISMASVTTVCGILSQPVGMAQTINHVPRIHKFNYTQTYMAKHTKAPGVAALRYNARRDTFVSSVDDTIKHIANIQENVDDVYIKIIGLDTKKAREFVSELGVSRLIEMENLIRAFESTIRELATSKDMPSFASTSLKEMVRPLARLRASYSRFNGYVKQLNAPLNVVGSAVDHDGLRALAKLATTKLGSHSFL